MAGGGGGGGGKTLMLLYQLLSGWKSVINIGMCNLALIADS